MAQHYQKLSHVDYTLKMCTANKCI